MNTRSKLQSLSFLVAASALVVAASAACSSTSSTTDESMGGAGGAMATGGASSTGGTSTSTGGGGGDTSQLGDIVEIAQGNPDFSLLVEAVVKAGLVDALKGDGLTVFAPTNAAFEALLAAIGKDSIDDLTAEQLKPILLYHVVGSVVDASDATTLASGDMMFTSLGGTVKITSSGSDLLLDESAKITSTDIEASNGLIHVIDKVILPSITDVVVTDSSLSKLKELVLAADGADGTTPKVATALDAQPSSGAYTLFAPSNAAVNALASAPSGQGLTDVLLYHVHNGAAAVYAADALSLNNAAVSTLFGSNITVNGGSSVTIAEGSEGTATVTVADLYTENGVIHIINDVLIPPAK